MAYTRTTWNNLSDPPINADNLNKIEQGIYDNSLGIDKINPSGTATTTAEIEEGQIADVIGFKSLKLKGQTSQYTTQGNNLLNIYARHPAGYTETVSGVTITYNDDGSVSARGTATADINFFLASNGQLGDDIFNGTNYLSGCTGGSSTTFHLQFWADTIGHFQNTTTEVATNKTAGVNWNITIGIKNGVTIDKTFYPMMSATSGKTFEKYSGGKASPNPDFPQDVNNVSGYNVVAINGSKNLFDKDINIVTPGYLNANGAVVTSDTTLSYQDRFIKVQPSTVYTISSGTNTIYRIAEYTADKTFITRVLNANASRSYTFTTSSQTYFIKMAGTLTTVLNTLQIEKGNTATSYVAHQGNYFEINLATNVFLAPRTWQNTSTVTTQANRLFSTPQKLVKAGTYKLATTLDFTTYKYALEVGTTPYPFASNLHDSGWKTTNNFSHTIPKGFVGIIVARLDNANITVDEMKGVKFELRDTTLDDYDIELCKIGTYQDYIYKKDGKWWKHKEIGKIVSNGSETWTTRTASTGAQLYETSVSGFFSTQSITIGYSNQYIADIYLNNDNTFRIMNGNILAIHNDTIGSLADFKTFLSNNNVITYYPLATPIDEEITYAPLLRQLDELYNSGLYDETNISQDNSSEVFILDLEACKNNINGIVEYIRR